jgi:hypothetical protein
LAQDSRRRALCITRQSSRTPIMVIKGVNSMYVYGKRLTKNMTQPDQTGTRYMVDKHSSSNLKTGSSRGTPCCLQVNAAAWDSLVLGSTNLDLYTSSWNKRHLVSKCKLGTVQLGIWQLATSLRGTQATTNRQLCLCDQWVWSQIFTGAQLRGSLIIELACDICECTQ